MTYLKQFIQLWKKPFPQDENPLIYYRTLLLVSLFVAFFLYVFQPFGVHLLEKNKLLICIGFGSMTFLGAMLYELFTTYVLGFKKQHNSWIFGKWMLNNFGIMLIISLANFLFARLVLFGFIQWNLFPPMLYGTFMIGIIPFTTMGAFKLLRNERKYLQIAQEINAKHPADEKMEIQQATIFGIPIQQIRYIEALQNYAKIGYLDSHGIFKVDIKRSTLKEILSSTENTSIIKCHRSYLVNQDTILSASGNAQGLLLTLADCEHSVPVSRTHVHLFR